MAERLFTVRLAPADPEETYGNVTPQQWRDGLRYADIMSARFIRDRLPNWGDPDDIRSAALIGLMKAAEWYRPERGAWSTYMHPAIARYMQRAWVAQQNWHRGRGAASRFWEEPGYDPDALFAPTSLDKLTRHDGDALHDLLPGETPDPEAEVVERLEQDSLWQRILAALPHLTPKEREVVEARLSGFRFCEIVSRLGLSRQ